AHRSDSPLGRKWHHVYLHRLPFQSQFRLEGNGGCGVCRQTPGRRWGRTAGAGTSIKWPVGWGGKGNEGVAGMIRQMQGSIGYIELIYAVQNKIPYGSGKNAAGDFCAATP